MILLIIIPVYISLNLYILHRVHKWLTACSERFHSGKFAVPYIVIYSLLALSLLFAFLLPSSELQVLVKRISNYWLGTFAYILIFIAVADILRLVLKKIPGKIHDFFFSKVGYVFVGILLTALIGDGQLCIVIDDPAARQFKCRLDAFFGIQIPNQLQVAINNYVVILIQTGTYSDTTCDYIIAGQRCKHGRCQTEAKRQCQGQYEYSFHSLVSFLLQFY